MTKSRRIVPGTNLDRHVTVLGVAARRSSAPVYLVWNHRTWCPMACKLFPSYARAAREARLLRAVEHPHIVRCFGAGRAGYLLMEFLEGPRLSSFIEGQPEGRMPIADALRAAIYLGSALIHMHGCGYLHLDVKPSNVIVYRGRPVLFDLDIARPWLARRSGPVGGTTPYMAPEQCVGGFLAPASDVFSLGVTLFEALTGALPFPESRGRRRHPQITAAPMPLRSLRPQAPKALEALVTRCLAVDAAERPALEQLLPALHAFIDDGPGMWPAGFNPR